jgi:putative transposase
LFRTTKVKLVNSEIDILFGTAILYRRACQITLDFGFRNKTYNKNKLNTGTYRLIREQMSELPSALVQCARDQASEMLKRERCERLPTKKKLQIRYDKRTFKFFPESGHVSLSTAIGRLNFAVRIYDHAKRYLGGEYTSAQLIIVKDNVFLNIQCKLADMPQSLTKKRVLGIDRGILNIVTCDDNSFINSKHLRAVKGRYQHLKSKLQSLGTRSAKRKLTIVAGRERRFALDTNHVIAKQISKKPDYDVFAVEKLHVRTRKENGKKFNKMLGGWSHGQLQSLLKYKAENAGKMVIEVNPQYTSQKCSKCGYVHRQNRNGLRFKCRQCGFELNAGLNAARNIGQLGKAELVRLQVNQPTVAPIGSYKPEL